MDMEKRNVNVSFGKNGNGFDTTRITLPVGWVKELGFSREDSSAIISFENNSIIIRKSTEKEEKEILLEKAESMLQKLETKSVTGNKRNSLKSSLNILLTECYNKKIDIEYLAVKYDIIKEINVYKTNEGKGSVVVGYEKFFNFKKEEK